MDYKKLERRVEKLETEMRPVEYKVTIHRHVIGEPLSDSTREIYLANNE